MIRHEGPRVYGRPGGLRYLAQAREESLRVDRVAHDASLFDPAEHHVVQRPGAIEPCLSGHPRLASLQRSADITYII
jgi:hypothetical protein